MGLTPLQGIQTTNSNPADNLSLLLGGVLPLREAYSPRILISADSLSLLLGGVLPLFKAYSPQILIPVDNLSLLLAGVLPTLQVIFSTNSNPRR